MVKCVYFSCLPPLERMYGSSLRPASFTMSTQPCTRRALVRAGGSLVSGYDSGSSFGDMGMGLDARYRLTPGFGLEASLSQHRGGEGDRVSTPLSLGVQAFAFSTNRVNPYAAAGVTFTGRDFDDTFCDGDEYFDFVTNDTLFGPYGGLGLEFAVGQNATVNLEGRLNSYMDLAEEDPTVPVSFQGRAGLNFYL